MTTPTVSVLINNYNYARFLRAAIDSVLAQTHPAAEIIVVDDGSTDDSRDILLSYGDKIRPILKANGGQGSAFNAGFADATGDIICFLDADDYFGPTALERILAHWRDDTDILHHRLFVVDNAGQVLGLVPPAGDTFETSAVMPALLERGGYPYPPTTGQVYSRRILQKILPMPEPAWRICADTYLATAAPLLAPITMMLESVAYYRCHSANAYNSFGAPDTRRTLRRSVIERQVTLGAYRYATIQQYAKERGLPAPTMPKAEICFGRLLLYRSGPEPYRLSIASSLYADLLHRLHVERHPGKYRLQKTIAGLLVALAPRSLLRRIYPLVFVPPGERP